MVGQARVGVRTRKGGQRKKCYKRGVSWDFLPFLVVKIQIFGRFAARGGSRVSHPRPSAAGGGVIFRRPGGGGSRPLPLPPPVSATLGPAASQSYFIRNSYFIILYLSLLLNNWADADRRWRPARLDPDPNPIQSNPIQSAQSRLKNLPICRTGSGRRALAGRLGWVGTVGLPCRVCQLPESDPTHPDSRVGRSVDRSVDRSVGRSVGL